MSYGNIDAIYRLINLTENRFDAYSICEMNILLDFRPSTIRRGVDASFYYCWLLLLFSS